MKHLRRRLTYANVMSTIAVFLVLGGGAAVAATQIGTNQIKAGAVTTGKLGPEAVAQGKIKAGAVGESRLGNGSVSAAKIATGAVGESKLGDGSVTGAKLATGAVTAGKLGTGSVTAGTIAPGAVSSSAIGANAVSGDAIASGSVGAEKIAGESVTAAKLATGSVIGSKIGRTEVLASDYIQAEPNEVTSSRLGCPQEQTLLSGGFFNNLLNPGLVVLGDVPGGPNEWNVSVRNTTSEPLPYRIYVLCLK